MRIAVFAVLACCSLVLGCSDDGATSAGTGDAPGPTWSSLVAADWELDGGQEAYVCTRTTLTEDVWVRALRPAGLDTLHHALIMIEDAGDDGTFPCSVGTVGPNLLYASGVGTGEYALPSGVAVHLAKGQKLLLQLHLFNVTGTAATGSTGVEAVVGEAVDTEHEAEMVLAGRPQLDIPPGEAVEAGSCTMSADVTLFGLWPHMHQLGKHLSSVAVPAAGDPIPLWDAAFDFGEQPIVDLPAPVTLAKGDRVDVECTYQNTTNETVHWGEGSNDEMCFIGLYRYPKVANLPVCAN